MREEIFGPYFSGRPFCSNGVETDSHTALLKAMITSENQKEKFACALQNASSVRIEKPKGKHLSQKPFLMAFLKRNSTADIFPGMFRLFWGKFFHKASLIKKDLYIV